MPARISFTTRFLTICRHVGTAGALCEPANAVQVRFRQRHRGRQQRSPIINKNRELVGLIFDSNIQSLVGNFEFDYSVNRAISVDVGGMMEALGKIFKADAIANELMKG